MRAAVLAALALAPSLADAEPRQFPRLGVWRDTVKQLPDGVQPLANVSRVLYLNDCRPNGCTVLPGFDDSRTNRSSIAENQRLISPFSYGDAYWNNLVQCVRETYAPFDIEIVTDDPGSMPHFEVMIGGRATQLHPELQGAGGVAPFIDCSTTQDNVISFVFSDEVNDLEFLCGAVAQEATHVWGLDHEMHPDDPMTYLQLGSLKRFQPVDAPCGEFSERGCFCGGTTQNSVQFLNNRFGPATLLPASVRITAPAEQQWVKAGFVVRAELDSQLSFVGGTLAIDGTAVQTIGPGPIAFTAPADLAGGAHAIEVSVRDAGDRTVSDAISVRVMAACNSAAPCPASFHCLGGFCLPGANEPGGLGATCSDNTDCITEQCGSDGTVAHCTAPCDSGGSCPAGFACLGDGGGGLCWPSEGGGGCATGGGGAGLALAGLGVLALVPRRRRR
jgi:hypothetical protein